MFTRSELLLLLASLAVAGLVLWIGAGAHSHATVPAYPQCREVVTLHRDASRVVYEYRATTCEGWH